MADASSSHNALQGSVRRQGTGSGTAAGRMPSGGNNAGKHRGNGYNNPRGQREKIQNTPPCHETATHQKTGKSHPIAKLIPQSIYNPETGKVLGFLSAEDLLIAALILLLIDSGDDENDNSMLIYALVYILISEHIDLPFL